MIGTGVRYRGEVDIPLTQGQVTLVDDVDADLAGLGWYAWKGKRRKTFYAVRSVHKPDGGRATELLHQHVARRMGILGPPDHIDRNGLNNSRSNLRPANNSQQIAHQGLRANSTSGLKGVCFNKARRRWQAQITVKGKQRYLGLFSDPIDAAKAYDRAALSAFGEFAVLNFPEPRSL